MVYGAAGPATVLEVVIVLVPDAPDPEVVTEVGPVVTTLGVPSTAMDEE
jgi:hypothetical protein